MKPTAQPRKTSNLKAVARYSRILIVSEPWAPTVGVGLDDIAGWFLLFEERRLRACKFIFESINILLRYWASLLGGRLGRRGLGCLGASASGRGLAPFDCRVGYRIGYLGHPLDVNTPSCAKTRPF